MQIPQYIIDSQPSSVRKNYRYWEQYMEERVSFSLPTSEVHGKGHSKRVLLYALMMVRQRLGENEEAMRILSHAAVFHDTRRLDDWSDTGHGARAAIYYKDFCRTGNIPFSNLASEIMKYHDRDDRIGVQQITTACPDEKEAGIELYRIFKDADALDRFRLGPNGLDTRFLRNKEALNLVDFAESLVRQTVSAAEMKKTMEYIQRQIKEGTT
ncbi:hypothetical protein [Phocaeicola dorei]|uniref:HD domain-containing protein n=1 Tax=Phocaeicola dorei TaxID=357276 RepID=A0A5M5ZQE6_9BACT|nr:hypothetical protein [Phocaeicola dorei]KAA5379385.1 hypothetical protein F2Y61_21105 [Phocaeicola dorei]